MEKARDYTKKIVGLLLKPEMRILPGNLAFFIVLTIIPMVALLVTLAAALSISTDSIYIAIAAVLPKEVTNLINSIIVGNGINFNIIIFYFSAFILASNGSYSMINVSNEIYKTKPNNIIARRLKSVIMTFILVGLFLFLIIFPVFGNIVRDIINEITKTNTIMNIIQNMIIILKYPLVLLILYLNIKLMYIIAPDEDIPNYSVSKGALFTSIGWVLSTEVFSFYVDEFARYDLFYGSISNILVLLLWVYLLSYIFVLGMIINASNYKNEQLL